MRNKIKTIALSRLRHEEHFGLHDKVAKLVNEYNLSEIFSALVEIYNDRYDELDTALEIIRRSVHTAQLQELDQKRRKTFRGLRTTVASYLRHFESAKCQAAIRVHNILWHYRTLMRKSRNERTASLTNMLQDLQDGASADLQTLSLTDWVSELEANNLSYKNLEAKRLSERASQFDKNVLLAREAMDAAYQSLVKSIEIHMALSPTDENGAALVNEWNARIDSVAWPVAQRRGMAAKKQEVTETASSSSSSMEVAGQMAG
ncbi:MAG: DUF6261 family protein [Puniceicoccales bacterium]|jgi:hypothetical protein|nr:DUF6261 family protein [Puniceicoccales bacterium]